MGDVPTVFISLKKDGHTWVPKTGDEITSPTPIGHPLLELVAPVVTAKTIVFDEPHEEVADEPEVKETKQSSVATDKDER